MKTVSEKLPHVSAYPLKALNLPEEEYQSELKLWEYTGGKSAGNLRVFPMVNPYREKDFTSTGDQTHSDK